MRLLLTLRGWEVASVLSFVYTAVAALIRPGLPRAARVRAVGGSVAGLLLTTASALAPFHPLLHHWLLPPALLLLGYWTSGLLFVAPMKPIEKLFTAIDRFARVRKFASLSPYQRGERSRVLLCGGLRAGADRARASSQPVSRAGCGSILDGDPGHRFRLLCGASLGFRRARRGRWRPGEPWVSSLRAFNLRWVDRASIQVNTFPSGHAAEALAAALLVSNLRVGIFIWMLVCAAAVSAGAVFGRYHYAIDAVAGWMVATGVWVVLRP